MDGSKPTEALIPGLEGVALRQLHLVDGPQDAAQYRTDCLPADKAGQALRAAQRVVEQMDLLLRS